MFESLRKKFSETSGKLTKKLEDEAEEEDNIEKTDLSDEKNLIDEENKDSKSEDKEKIDESISSSKQESKNKAELDKTSKDSEKEDEDESNDIDDESESEVSDEGSDEDEEKSGFFSSFRHGSKNKDNDDESESDDNIKEDNDDEELDDKSDDGESESEVSDEGSDEDEEKSGFFSSFRHGSKNKDNDDESESDDNIKEDNDDEELDDKSDDEESESEVSDEGSDEDEDKSGFFSSFRRGSKNKNNDDEELDDKSEDIEEDETENNNIINESEEEDETFEEDDKKSGFFSSLTHRSKDKKDEEESEDKNEASDEKSEDPRKGKGGFFSFIKEKTLSEDDVDEILSELEMSLLEGDVAIDVATTVVDSVKEDLVGQKIKRSSDIEEYTYDALRNAISKIIDIEGKSMTELIEMKKKEGEPLVVMFVGINGTGKTTTIGKLANYYLKKGYTPVIAASDTFRAGAIEQVTYHADNVGVKIIKHEKGSDPAAVAFDAVAHAKAHNKELVLIDTAGRMQTNTNLMDEMKKIRRVAKPDLVIFVGDALTGNDATEQATKFNEAIDIDGVILTKADADSKGGASLSIGYVIKKPIMFLGMGQGYDDIIEYDANWMLDQLFAET